MRSLIGALRSLAFIVATLSTSVGLAQQPHSWCVTGAPLVLGGSTDPTTNAVIAEVCDEFSRCCSTRWDLSCVQNGARFARDTLSAGDVCGRYAWAQGPIPGTQQYYPRDFNLFATTGGVNGIRDTDGPVAAASSVTFLSFHANIDRREPIGVLTGGGAVLNDGTIAGSVIYRTFLTDSGVTYVDAPRPTSPTNPSPIDFAAAKAKLIAMSAALLTYDAVPATKQYTTVTFSGSDPELNVFTVPSSMLLNTYTYSIVVPAGSNVIINVTGANPAIRYAGFSMAPLRSLLWNFADATSLVLDSVGFPGSILAPNATANLRNGSIAGTVVVASGSPADVELYASPYRAPSSVGAPAIDVDPSWSFTGNISDDGTATDFEPEAGFLEIEGGPYTAEGDERVSPTHRIWYSFQPAVIQPKTKPLAVFFQGGPGHATSSILFAFNTGPWTLDPSVAGASEIVVNPRSANWAQFANLLYIDSPATGFSYPLPVDGVQPSVGNDLDHDASIVVRVILRFLQRHPEIMSNRVVLVGESYGGVRATLMLRHLFNVSSLLDPPYINEELWSDETEYFTKVFGTGFPTPVQVASKFGHQVLIDAVVAGAVQANGRTVGTSYQFPASNCLSPTCSALIPGVPATPDMCDIYNCDKPFNWSDMQEFTAANRLVEMDNLKKALGVGPSIMNIEWMKAAARTQAYGRNDGSIVAAPDMVSAFGTLGSEDTYFMIDNQAVQDGYPGASHWSEDGAALTGAIDFANHLHNGVTTFMTAAKYDLVVWGPETPYAFATLREEEEVLSALLQGIVIYDQNAMTGLSRPGAFWLSYTSDHLDQRMVTMPHFYESGHSVTMRAPAALLADVEIWYNNSPH